LLRHFLIENNRLFRLVKSRELTGEYDKLKKWAQENSIRVPFSQLVRILPLQMLRHVNSSYSSALSQPNSLVFHHQTLSLLQLLVANVFLAQKISRPSFS
jgi:hypothetical protein